MCDPNDWEIHDLFEPTDIILVREVYRIASCLVNKDWCQNAYAKTIDGEEIDATLDEAFSFSLLGALQKASLDVIRHQQKQGNYQIEPITLYRWSFECLYDIIPHESSYNPMEWNNSLIRTQNDVVNLLNKASVGEKIKSDSILFFLIRLPLIAKRLFL